VLEAAGVVTEDVDGVDGQLLAGNDPVEVDEGDALDHGPAKPIVVVVDGVGTPVPVAQEAIDADLVLIGALPSFDPGRRGDAQRRVGQYSGLEDALRPNEAPAGPHRHPRGRPGCRAEPGRSRWPEASTAIFPTGHPAGTVPSGSRLLIPARCWICSANSDGGRSDRR